MGRESPGQQLPFPPAVSPEMWQQCRVPPMVTRSWTASPGQRHVWDSPATVGTRASLLCWVCSGDQYTGGEGTGCQSPQLEGR